MEFMKTDISYTLQFQSAGQFISEERWTHSRRCLQSFELIIGVQGTLYMEQDQIHYKVTPGDVLILFPDRVHSGYRASDAVSFYWLHFFCPNPYEILRSKQMSLEMDISNSGTHETSGHRYIYIPCFHKPTQIDRVNLIFQQIQHMANTPNYNSYGLNYLVSVLLIEISQQYLTTNDHVLDQRITEMLEWIRVHSARPMTVIDLANRFGYNKDYLSRMFKRKMGMNLIEYIHTQKISLAKEMLSRTHLSAKEISFHIGFNDDKYFLKLFKQYENMTPTDYRRAFYLKHLNKE